mmetsp:Transcript_120631/g.341736  ORF Transcript_120631/g.341736 Transcript_120631/m.341736 type:complete len:480 (-) Transcript_120631:6-1445(-)
MTDSLCAVEDHSVDAFSRDQRLRHLACLSRSQREQLVETYGKPRHEYLCRKAERRVREIAARSRKEAQQQRKGEWAHKRRLGCGKRGSWGFDAAVEEEAHNPTAFWGADLVLARRGNRPTLFVAVTCDLQLLVQPSTQSSAQAGAPTCFGASLREFAARRTGAKERREQERAGAQSLRGLGVPNLQPLGKHSHAERVFHEMLGREARFAAEWAVFYHCYNTPALVYEVQAAIARVAFNFNSEEGPLPRLLMAPFHKIPNARALLEVFPSWAGQDHHPDFKQVGICCSTSLVSQDPEATPTQCFLRGYGITPIGRPVLVALLQQAGAGAAGPDAGWAAGLAAEIAALAARFGILECGRPSGHLLQIFVHRSCVDRVAYASLPMGWPDPSRTPLSLHLGGKGPVAGQARLVANPAAFLCRSAVRLHVGSADEAVHAGRGAFQKELCELLRPAFGDRAAQRRICGIRGCLPRRSTLKHFFGT